MSSTTPRAVALVLAAAVLAACGGGEPEPAAADAILPTLIDDEGELRPAVPQAIPDDPAARTRAGRYALRVQAEQLDAARPGQVVWVDVDCCAVAGVDDAVAQAELLALSLGLDRDAPVFVTGASARRAADVVDRLGAAGRSHVFLVR